MTDVETTIARPRRTPPHFREERAAIGMFRVMLADDHVLVRAGPAFVRFALRVGLLDLGTSSIRVRS